MGQSLNPLATTEAVPDDVKAAIPPIDYVPAPVDARPTDHEQCEDCGEFFGWFLGSTNCDCCGRQLCTRCCPKRHLLHDNPGCMACTQKAYEARRAAMLNDHYSRAGYQARSRQTAPNDTITAATPAPAAGMTQTKTVETM